MNDLKNKIPLDLNRPLTERQAEEIFALGRDAAVYVMLALSELVIKNNLPADQKSSVGETPAPETPSGMIPPYLKETKRGRKKKPGAKPGHPGSCRPTPQITSAVEHPPPEFCPDCGGPLGDPVEHRKRIIEDIVVSKPEAVEHDIPRCWCPACKKNFEPPVADALPGASIGHRFVALSAWLHYGLGVTISQIIEIVGRGFQFEISPGGLVQMWHRIAEILHPWYEQIGAEVRAAGVLHADETGWRVNGATHWLWCFTCKTATYYMIDRSRGSPALSKFFTSAIDGILVTDFWAAYNAVVCAARQACLPHLLRELEKVDKTNDSMFWKEFSKKLKRLLRDALRLAARRGEMDAKTFASRKNQINRRLDNMLEKSWWYEGDRQRLAKRLRKFRDAMFTFLENPAVPSSNNHAEREIRPAVIMRKNSYCNRSERGANTQAVLMSVYRTLRLRGHDPLREVVAALRAYVETGKLPPLPSPPVG